MYHLLKSGPIHIFKFTLINIVCLFQFGFTQNIQQADFIIYGGSSAAVIAAVHAKRLGHSVILVSPEKHLGGLTSNGLGWTDTGNKEVIGGLAREFYQRIYQHYEDQKNWKWQDQEAYGNKGQGTIAMDGDKRTMWIFEPHAAENVFEQFIKEESIELYRDEWLDRDLGVTKVGGKITSIRTLSGKQFEGSVFIDATYEGDLIASAGIDYHVGREANEQYGEEWNGIQTGVLHHRHHFMTDISPFKVSGDPNSGLLPRISAADPGEKGKADRRLQAYCFRMCLSNHPENRVPFKKPVGYDRSQYALLGRIYATGWDETFHKFDPIPNRKTDTNNHGPFSTDNIGMNYEYPEGSYRKRQQIIQEHLNYQQGLMYYLSHDQDVPEKVRKEMSQWGLAKDEFVDNDHWPHKIYVREARRMIGDFVMTEHEVLGKRDVLRPIGMGSYTLDSHNVQRYIKPDGFVQNEGDIGVKPDKPYQIDVGAILPKRNQCTNLLAPICVSSSHIAFGSIRMEPVFMILGQSAATVGSLAITDKLPVQDVNYSDLKKELIQSGQILKH